MAVCARCGQENPEGFRFCGACGAELAVEIAAAREVRKTVTVVFSDVTGSTALGERLDPEALRRVMSRYFEEMSASLQRHGGTVEKFIGDAIMAVFGVPVLHEDDALRAVRAAAEMREGLASLNTELARDYGVSLQLRIGVNTGEVVTGTEERLATGDAVNVAARLEQAAPPGEILLGEETHRLCRDAVRAEAVEPIPAKGKAEPVAAWRLLEVLPDASGFARRLDAPMVGRAAELAQLRQAFDRTVRERRCHLFTVLGSAGVGKSRLARELVAGLGDGARSAWGRCLSYGEGITYWPLVEIFRELGVEERLGGVLAAGTAEETFLAVRRFLEGLARERPLVLVLDDLHWAEPTFLDLVEHVADWSRDAPVFLVCLARPELLETRPAWGGGKVNAATILLEPLAEAECDALIDALLTSRLSDPVRRRIVATAEGNPLFVEQVLAMLAERGADGEEITVPPTIQALMAARLDALPAGERELAELASVIGKQFDRASVAELASERLRPSLEACLLGLIRKELVRPEREEGVFGFAHVLIRDTAYEAMPKELRAELHERFAAWLERSARDRIEEHEEIVGYHLEQAHRYRTELGPADARADELAGRAAERLSAAGARAHARGDVNAAANLLERAAALLAADDERRVALLPLLAGVLVELGSLVRAREVADEAVERAQALGDRRLAARAVIERLFVRWLADPEGVADEAENETERLIPVLEELGDEGGLARAWQLVGQVHLMRCRFAEMAAATRRALEHALRAGDERQVSEALFWIPAAYVFGPIPAEEAIRSCDELRGFAEGRPLGEAYLWHGLGILHSMVGRADEARVLIRSGRAFCRELGLEVHYGGSAMGEAWVEMYSGDLAAAEAVLREGIDLLERVGERSYLSTAAAVLGQVLVEQGRHDEAEEWTRLSERAGAPDDIATQAGWRSVRARVLARRGEAEEAERLAREALERTDATDAPDWRGEARVALAEALEAAGRREEAVRAAEEALAIYGGKGIRELARRARELSQRLGEPPATA